jgi:hypothetical protein
MDITGWLLQKKKTVGLSLFRTAQDPTWKKRMVHHLAPEKQVKLLRITYL